MTEELPITILYNWFSENSSSIWKHCTELEFRDSGKGSASIDFSTEHYLFEICVWNHNCSLDIGVINSITEESEYPTVGSNKSTKDLVEKIQCFYNYLETNSFKPEIGKISNIYA